MKDDYWDDASFPIAKALANGGTPSEEQLKEAKSLLYSQSVFHAIPTPETRERIRSGKIKLDKLFAESARRLMALLAEDAGITIRTEFDYISFAERKITELKAKSKIADKIARATPDEVVKFVLFIDQKKEQNYTVAEACQLAKRQFPKLLKGKSLEQIQSKYYQSKRRLKGG